jgi:hypothetical protein
VNKLKKIAAVITAIVAVGGFANMSIPFNIIASESVADLTVQTSGDWGYSVFSDGTVVIRGYRGDDETVTIPSQINGRTVTEIDDLAIFIGTNPLDTTKEIILPNTIRKINAGAFMNCINLVKINIPDSLKEIGARAFYGCSSLKTVNLNKVEKLGFGVFEKCSALEQITIPGTIKTIPEWAFHKCTGLKSLVINSGVTTIEKEAALNTPALERIVIPDSVSSVGEYAFCYLCEFHKVNEGSYVGYYEYTLNADNLKEYNCGSGSAAEKYGIDNGIIEVFEGKLSHENKVFPTIPPINRNIMGDPNSSGAVDASDASTVLAEYSAVQTGKKETFTETQKIMADVNRDGAVDAIDASEILRYYADLSTGKNPTWSWMEKIKNKT